MPSDGGKMLVEEVFAEDQKLLDEIKQKKGQTKEIYEIYWRRYSLYQKAINMPIDPVYQGLLINSAQVIQSEIIIFQNRIEFEEQIAKIVSRLDVLESDILNIKKKML
jgi:hypothetical protein